MGAKASEAAGSASRPSRATGQSRPRLHSTAPERGVKKKNLRWARTHSWPLLNLAKFSQKEKKKMEKKGLREEHGNKISS